MTQSLPPGQNPIDPRGAYSLPPNPPPGFPPGGSQGPFPPTGFSSGGYPPGFPPMMPPPWRPRGGAWKTALIILLIIALGISVMGNLMLAGGSVSASEVSVPQQTTLKTGDSQTKIAVIPVEGIIDDASARTFDQWLTTAEKDTNIKALIISIDTPGGGATASDEMYHRLLLFKQTMKDANRTVPVIIDQRSMATSGGYYLSCAGDYIFAEPGTLTGNIGVIFPRVNVSDLFQKYGIKETTLTATTEGHSFKNAGSMMEPANPQDELYLQGLIDGIFAQFKNAVNTGRKGKLVDTNSDIFSGKAFLADEAKARGLVDQIGYADDCYAYAAKTASITNPTIVWYSKQIGLLGELIGSGSDTPSRTQDAGKNFSASGINVNMSDLEKLLTARPLLLWRGN